MDADAIKPIFQLQLVKYHPGDRNIENDGDSNGGYEKPEIKA